MAKRHPLSLSSLSVATLEREIAKRRSKVGGLEQKARRLRAQLAKVEARIAALGGPVGGGGRGAPGRARPRNDANLVDVLVKVLSGKEMGIPAIIEAVQKAGYRSGSPNFRVIVSQALTRDKRIKRVSRGVYAAK